MSTLRPGRLKLGSLSIYSQGRDFSPLSVRYHLCSTPSQPGAYLCCKLTARISRTAPSRDAKNTAKLVALTLMILMFHHGFSPSLQMSEG